MFCIYFYIRAPYYELRVSNFHFIKEIHIMDEFNREFIEFEVGISLPSVKVIQALQRAIEFRGKPKSIRVDNGPEFISHKLEQWCYIHSIELKFIQPGSPTQNSRMERLNGEIRDREKVMRGLKKTDTPILKGYQIYHNFIREHEKRCFALW